MNPADAIGRLARILAALTTAVLSFIVAPVALAAPTPHHHGRPMRLPVLPPDWNKHPSPRDSTQPTIKYRPGWTKHPPLPGHIHTVVTGGLALWQITLIAITAVALVAAVHAPRPGLDTRRKAGIRPTRPGMDDQSLRDLLDGALAGEPPIGPVAQNALTAGIRLRRRHRIWPQLP
jgi:hypothetical protein